MHRWWKSSRTLAVFFGLAWAIAWGFRPPAEKIVFLDVGQGEAMLLQSQTHQILIDGGAGMAVLSSLTRELPWFDRTIELVISTHPDKDHLEGLLHILERYRVKLVVLPEVSHTSRLYAEWLQELRDSQPHGLDFRFAGQGQRLRVGKIRVSLLGPGGRALALSRPGRTNNASVVTRVDFEKLSLLLTGDAERAAEKVLIEETSSGQLDVAVLKAGHHGSKTSTSAELISVATPSLAVISAGANNRYGHPHPEVLERLRDIPVLRTDEAGSIRFVRHQGQWLLKTVK